MTPNIGIIQITSLFGPLHLIMPSYHKNTFRTKHGDISSTLIVKQWVATLYMVMPGVKYLNFDQKITQNIGIMQIASQLGSFDNTK